MGTSAAVADDGKRLTRIFGPAQLRLTQAAALPTIGRADTQRLSSHLVR